MMKRYIFQIMAILFIATTLNAQNLKENFEEDSETKEFWTSNLWGWNVYISDYAAYEGTHYMLTQASEMDTVITPKLNIKSGDELRFYARKASVYYGTLKLLHSNDMNNWTEIVDLSDKLSPYSYANFFADLDSYTGEGYLAFAGRNMVMFDSLSGPEYILPNYDLTIKGFITPENISVNKESEFQIKIKNLTDIKADNYTVNLMNGENILASVDGKVVSGKDTLWVTIPYTPQVDGDFDIYPKIEYSLDENVRNNTYLPQTVKILAEGEYYMYIRRPDLGGSRSDYPIFMSKHTNVYEAIYPEELITAGGYIKKLDFQVRTATENMKDVPVKIWMGETNQGDLVNKWIPTSELQLVFDDSIDFKVGENYPVSFNFKEENYFHYSKTGNLVVFVEKPFTEETYAYSSVSFCMDFWDDDRQSVRRFWKDNSSINTDLLSTEGQTAKQYADIGLYINNLNTGSLTGTITNINDEIIENAKVKIQGADSYTFTNENGVFSIPSLPIGDYTLEVVADSYKLNTASFSITDGEESTLNIQLAKLPLINVVGTIKDELTNSPLDSAIITLNGDYNYSEYTSDDGRFMITDIYGDLRYTLRVHYPYREDQIIEITTTTDDYDAGTLSIKPILQPAKNVVAEIVNSDTVSISWETPDSSIVEIVSYSVYVLTANDTNSNNWSLVAERLVDTTAFDKLWTNLPQKSYQYAVQVNYANDRNSIFALSAPIKKERFANVSVQLSGSDSSTPMFANITYTNMEVADSTYSTSSDNKGFAQLNNIWHGNYNLKVSCPGYEAFEQVSNTIWDDEVNFTYTLKVIPFPAPQNVSYEVETDNIYLSWNKPEAGTPTGYRIFRNDELYKDNYSDTTLVDTALAYGDYTYTLCALYENGASKFTPPVSITVLELMPPTMLSGSSYRLNVTLTWTKPNNDVVFYDGFESYNNFVTEFEPWTLIDADGAYTFYNGQEFPNNITPKSFFIYNHSVISEDTVYYQAFAGKKVAMSFTAYQKNTQDWLITPPVYVEDGYSVNFWARSHTGGGYRAHFAVLAGTSPEIENMKYISDEHVEAPAEGWTEFNYDLSEFADEVIYVAIFRFDSEVTSFMMLDEFSIQRNQAKTSKNILGYNIYRDDIKLNNNPVAFENYSDIVTESGTYSYEVAAVYQSGESEKIGPFIVTPTIPEIEISQESFTLEITDSLPVTLPLTISNQGTANLEYEIDIRYDTWNFENSTNKKVENLNTEYLKNTLNLIPPHKNTDTSSFDLLWDNTDIFMGSGGLISMELGGLSTGNNLISGADDFYIEPGETWVINKISAKGYTSTDMNYPVKIGYIIYKDNNGLPGDEIITAYSDSVHYIDQFIELEKPLTLQGGHYWLSVFGYYESDIDLSVARWNWSSGTRDYWNQAVLQDQTGMLNFGGEPMPYTTLEDIEVNERSFYFQIEGSKSGKPFHWITLNQISDTVAVSETSSIDITFNPSGLMKGNYEAYLIVKNNAAGYHDIRIPCKLNIPVGINSNEEINVNVYPNPVNDILNIEGIDFNQVSVFNSIGQLVTNFTVINNHQVDLSSLTNGFYFIKIIDHNKQSKLITITKE